MQTIERRSVIQHILSAAVLAIAALSSPALAQKAERPDVKVGDRWRLEVRLGTGPSAMKLQDLSRVVTSVTAAGIERTDNGLRVVLTPDLNEIESTSYKHSDSRLLSFPLELGKQWHCTDEFLSKFIGKEARMNWSVAVVGYEKVRVPAGEFDAFKLEARGSWISGSHTGEESRTYWYALAARGVVKSEIQDTSGFTTTELAEFQLQP